MSGEKLIYTEEMARKQDVKDLLIPRVRVEIDYPSSPFVVGDILQLTDDEYVNGKKRVRKGTVDLCHRVFRKLAWFEHLEKCPDYIVDRHTGEVLKTIEFGSGAYFKISEDRFVLKKNWLPATQEEYEKQNKK